jgi:hypothetical protein
MLKRFTVLFFCFIFSASFFVATVKAEEASEIIVTLDGTALEFDVPPQIISGRTMVPMRVIFEALGASVEWESATQTVTAVRNGTTVVMRIGDTSMRVDGREVVIDVPPSLIDGRTLVPARAIAEGLGMDVAWNAASRSVIITSQPPTSPQATPEIPSGATERDGVFSDAILGMEITINNTEWIAYRSNFQVFFYNDVNLSEINLISISSIPFFEGEDADQAITWLWNEMRENHGNSPLTNFVYHERQAIQVSEASYGGYIYSFTAETSDGTVLMSDALFWIAGDRLFICTTSSDEEGAAEVQGVLDGILESFVFIAAAERTTVNSGVSVLVNSQFVDWLSGAEPFLDGAEIMLPLRRTIEALGGSYQEVEAQGQQRIVFSANNRILLIILGSREYAVTDLIETAGGFSFGEGQSYFLNSAPIVRNGEVFFPLTNFAAAMGLEVTRAGDFADISSRGA